MNNFVRLSAFTFAILGSACTNSELSTSPPGTPIPVVRLRSEPYSFTYKSGFVNPARLVVRDAAHWQTVWAQIQQGGSPVPSLPDIDFSREMLVVAALGGRPTGGYSILIEGASEPSHNLTAVAIRSISPGRRCFTTQAVTEPVDIARLPRREGVVRFVERSEITRC
jgi:hypothetical protein